MERVVREHLDSLSPVRPIPVPWMGMFLLVLRASLIVAGLLLSLTECREARPTPAS